MDHNALRALDEAQEDATAAARRRIETAEEHLHHYRAELFRLQETAYQLAQQHDIADHPDFRTVLQRLADECDENVRGGAEAIGRLEEGLADLTARHAAERDRLLDELR